MLRVDPPLHLVPIAGGRSNLTYRVTDVAGRRLALRRPPVGELLQTAHDMTREWTVLHAMQGTDVPAPTPLALCDDVTVTGAPFYVMDWVDGVVPADDRSAAQLSPAARLRLTEDLADVLAALHALEPDAVGLAAWRRPGDYLQRQLHRWHRQIHASGCSELDLADRVHDELVRRAPAGEECVVHGDYRAGNVMAGPDGRIRAVLDWELATLGHPLADLAWLLASWSSPDDEHPPATLSPTHLDGFGSRDLLLARYAERSNRDVSALPIYEAFARWRSACITAGVRARYVAGAMGADDYDAQEMDERLRQQLQAAAELLARM
jgi:aminoglycoside phosphotransferase (APT) family kinase protein